MPTKMFSDSALEILNSFCVMVGGFNNQSINFCAFSDDTENKIRESVIDRGFDLINRHDYTINAGEFEIQHHDHSVPSHTDDMVDHRTFFCVIPFAITRLSKGKFAESPDLVYFGANGKKNRTTLECGVPVIFNPRKPHQLDYFGCDVKLMIFSVERSK